MRDKAVLFLEAVLRGLYWLFGINVVIGAFLGIFYRVDSAHQTTLEIKRSMWVLAGFHYWASSLLILFSFGALCFAIWTATFRRENRAIYYSALVLFGASYIAQLTGNLLPMDVHDVRTAVVEGGVAARVPVVGSTVRTIILAGESFSINTVKAWYLIHILVVLTMFAPVILNRIFEKTKDEVANWGFVAIPSGLCLAFALALRAPQGAAAKATDFESFDAIVSWYAWPLHGSLNAFESISPGLGWIGSAIVPGIFATFLVGIPILDKKLSIAPIRLALLAFLGTFAVFAVGFGKSFAPLTGNQDVITEVVPEVKTQGTIDEALAEQGKLLFKNNNCGACHRLDEFTGGGGPSLTTTFKTRDRQWIEAFLPDPSKIKKGSTMPGYPDLKPDELKAMAEYLVKPR